MGLCPTARTAPDLRCVRWRFQTQYPPARFLQIGLPLASDTGPPLDAQVLCFQH
jgi:hypothetical protein